jgi:membrane fusion protein (multidrug efflux system)
VLRYLVNKGNRPLALWKRRTYFSGLLVLVLISVIKWIGHSKAPVSQIPNKVVDVDRVRMQTIQQRIRLLGILHPKHNTLLIAKGSGSLDALISTGQKVKKGALIATIDNHDVGNNVELSKSAANLAKRQYDRFAPLIDKGFVSPKELEEKKKAWIMAQKELYKAKIELDNLRFYAPFNGVVGAYKKREGAQVNQGELVVSVYDPSSLVVDFDIPCSGLSTLNEGQTVYVHHQRYSLTHVQKMLDEETHMCPADVDIRCEHCLIGATVAVDVVVKEKHHALVIPAQAVFLRNSKPVVYIVEKNKVQLISIKTGIKQQDKIEVVHGLKEGQNVITKGHDRLYPNMAVATYRPKK